MAHGDNAERAPRACDACRARKVRCDKGSPCSHCRSSGSVCRTTAVENKEPRSRVMVSKEYEKKIDRIGDRLANIEKLLQHQGGTASSELSQYAAESHSAAVCPTPDTHSSAGPIKAIESVSADIHDATTGTHSAAASRMVEQAVGGSLAAYSNSKLSAALNSLREMVQKIEDPPDFSGFDRHHWASDGEQSVKPPSEAEIERLVRSAEGSLSLAFCPGLTTPVLRQKVDLVLNRPAETSAVSRVYVYGVFWHLCAERSGLEPDQAFAKRCKGLARLFTVQIELAISELPLLMPVSAEAASALTMAAGIAVDLCKPHLALTLGSNAASMVLSLGYHRLSTMQSDTELDRQSKILMFWTAYWLDSSFSVRLGRAPVIRDYDITVPMLSRGSIVPDGFVDAFAYGIRIVSLQCKVVEQLYSPLALQQSREQRQSRAGTLLEELQGAWDACRKAPPPPDDDPYGSNIYLLMKESDAVMHYSTFALVQHATMTIQGESPAIEPARKALQLHCAAWKSHKHLPDFVWSGHCHWTLLKGPITPFTVTFCHIIAHPLASQEDLALLVEFVATLKALQRFSEGIKKLYRLCDIFARVATLYLQAKGSETAHTSVAANGETAVQTSLEWAGQPAVDNIDEYLSTMGFAPPRATSNGLAGGVDIFPEFDASFLGGWYEGTNSLMGLLEQDIGNVPFDYTLGYN